MSFKHVNFRSTAAYIADAASDTYCVPADQYPVTRNGLTFGWYGTPTSSDRRTDQGANLAGYNNYSLTGNGFRLNLPNGPGTYRLRLAAGLQQTASTRGFKIYDGENPTPIASAAEASVPSNNFMDATGAVMTAAAWNSSNAYITITSESGYIYIRRHTTQSNFGLATVGVENVPTLFDITSPGARAPAGSAPGTKFGTLSGHSGEGTSLALTSDAGGRVALSGFDLVAGTTATTYDPDAASLSVQVTETRAGYAGSPKVSTINIPVIETYTAPTAPPSDIWPGAGWTGTPSGVAPATDPVRTTAKPILRILDLPHTVFTEDRLLTVHAYAKGGIKHVKCYMEGRSATETKPRKVTYTDPNGVTRSKWGFAFNVDYSAFSGNGTFDVYFEAVPNNAAMQARVIGPFRFHRNPLKHDGEYTVDPTQAETATRFQTFAGAANRAKLDGKVRPRITFMTAGPHWLGAPTNRYSGAVENWITLEAAPGVSAVIGKAERIPGGELLRPYTNGILVGKGMKVDKGNFNEWYLEDASQNDGAPYYVGFDGAEYFSSLGANGLADLWTQGNVFRVPSTPEVNAQIWIKDSNFHDLAQGPKYTKLVLNTRLADMSGDVITSGENFYNPKVENIDSAPLRTPIPAIDVTYTGSGTVATMERTGTSGTTTTATDTTKSSESVSVNSATDVLTVAQDWATGTTVRIGGTTVPGGLVAGTTYYVIRVSSTQIKLATSASNASAGVAIDITSAGSGVRLHPTTTAGLIFTVDDNVVCLIPFSAANSGDEIKPSVAAATINAVPGFTATYISGGDARRTAHLTMAGVSGLAKFDPISVKGVTRQLVGAIDVHSDVYQNTGGPTDNIAIVNLEASDINGSQVIFLTNSADLRDIAIINPCVGTTITTVSSQVSSHRSHLLVWNLTMPTQRFVLRGSLDDWCDFQNGMYMDLDPTELGSYGAATADRNVVLDPGVPPFSVNTVVAPDVAALFVDYANGDFRPAADGLLVTNADYAPVPFDVRGIMRNSPSALGALEVSEVGGDDYVTITPGSTVTLTAAQAATLEAVTDGNAPGTGLMATLSWKLGAGETGATKSVELRYDID